ARVGTENIGIARADKGRFRSGVNRFAPGVRHLEEETLTELLVPFDLQAVVIAPRAVAGERVGGEIATRTAFVVSWQAQADFVRPNRHGDRASRRGRDSGQSGSSADGVSRQSESHPADIHG